MKGRFQRGAWGVSWTDRPGGGLLGGGWEDEKEVVTANSQGLS